MTNSEQVFLRLSTRRLEWRVKIKGDLLDVLEPFWTKIWLEALSNLSWVLINPFYTFSRFVEVLRCHICLAFFAAYWNRQFCRIANAPIGSQNPITRRDFRLKVFDWLSNLVMRRAKRTLCYSILQKIYYFFYFATSTVSNTLTSMSIFANKIEIMCDYWNSSIKSCVRILMIIIPKLMGHKLKPKVQNLD